MTRSSRPASCQRGTRRRPGSIRTGTTLWSRRGSCRNAVGAGTKGRREHSPAFPFAARSILAMPLVLGLLCGVAIALATVLIEHSRIEFGHYALYGNGAFAVPAIGVPLALYAGWTELARSHAERARRVAVALFAAGPGCWSGGRGPPRAGPSPHGAAPRVARAPPPAPPPPGLRGRPPPPR